MSESSIIPDIITDSSFIELIPSGTSMKETIPSTNKLSDTLFTSKLTQGNTESTDMFTHTDIPTGTQLENTESKTFNSEITDTITKSSSTNGKEEMTDTNTNEMTNSHIIPSEKSEQASSGMTSTSTNFVEELPEKTTEGFTNGENTIPSDTNKIPTSEKETIQTNSDIDNTLPENTEQTESSQEKSSNTYEESTEEKTSNTNEEQSTKENIEITDTKNLESDTKTDYTTEESTEGQTEEPKIPKTNTDTETNTDTDTEEAQTTEKKARSTSTESEEVDTTQETNKSGDVVDKSDKVEESETDTEETKTDFSPDSDINIIPIINIDDTPVEKVTDFIQEILQGYDSDFRKYTGINYNLTIKPINSDNEDNDSANINFTECENIIKEKYGLEEDETLTIVQLEIDNTNSNDRVLTNQVEYQIYLPNKTKVDTSICKDATITIEYPLNSNNMKSIDYDIVDQFKDTDVNVFDINEPFFTDICTPYSSNGNDVILEDRHDYIYQNYSLCDKNCERPIVDLINHKVTCQCKIKGNINTQTEINFQQIDNKKYSNSNLDVIKCYNLVFSSKDKKKNAGFILFTILALLFIGLIVLHIIRGINPVPDFIYEEMKKYDYLKKDDRKFFEEDDPDKKTKFKNYNKKNVATIGNISISNNKQIQGSIINANNKKKGYISNISNISPNPKSSYSSERNLMFSNILFKSRDIEDAKFNPPIKKAQKNNNRNIILSKPRNRNDHVLDVFEQDSDGTKPEEMKEYVDNFGIMKINLNEPLSYFFPKESKLTLRNYNYKEAIKYENRSIWRILYIFLLAKQIIFHTFFERSPLVPFHIKLGLFIFMLSFDIAINALFYTTNNISEKYHTSKDLFSFTWTNNVLIIIISTIVSLVFISIIIKLNKIDTEIRTIFLKEETKLKKNKNYSLDYPTKMRVFSDVEKVLKYYKIKSIIILVIEFLFILFFWYFVTAFCQVYLYTQGSLALNVLIAVLIRFVIEVIVCLLLAKLYDIAVHMNFSCFYDFILFVYDLSC